MGGDMIHERSKERVREIGEVFTPPEYPRKVLNSRIPQ